MTQRIEIKRRPGRPAGTLRPGATATLQVRLTPEQKAWLAKAAEKRSETMSEVIAGWIDLCTDT